MIFRVISVFLAIGAIIFGGCGQSGSTAGTATVPALPTHAQGQLATIRLWLGPEELITEMALTPDQEATGMMFRTNMPENTAMIFVLRPPQRASFWMMHCPLPLSIAYIDPEGVVQEIHNLEPGNTNSVLSNSEDIAYALETPQGWFKRHHISEGVKVRTEKGSLSETFK